MLKFLTTSNDVFPAAVVPQSPFTIFTVDFLVGTVS